MTSNSSDEQNFKQQPLVGAHAQNALDSLGSLRISLAPPVMKAIKQDRAEALDAFEDAWTQYETAIGWRRSEKVKTVTFEPTMRSLALLLLFFVCSQASLPEESLTAPEIISYYEYPVEIITVETKDGYLLQLHRIPFGKNDYKKPPSKKPVVFLQHGLLASSADWVTNLPNQSAAFLLADAGFDVWMGNVRGNCYSTGHRKYSRKDKEYWQFTWDDMAKYDLDAMITAVLNITKRSDLYYIGHSQGTVTMFGKLASDPAFSSKIRKFFALAPVGSVGHIRGALGYIGKYLVTELQTLFKLFGQYEFLPSTFIQKMFARMVCGFHFENPLCENFLFQIGGPESSQFNQTRLMVYMTHTPAGTSTNNVIHWGQMVRSGKMQYYDFGCAEENEKHYGTPNPPVYNLSTITTPVYLYWSDADWLADTADIKETLLPQLKAEVLKQNNQMKDFNHFDFIWGLRAADEIYKPIIEIIKTHEKNRRHF
ncbi:hypothetical protein QR680_012036 [Steinernema hermaphroditum]|uniref:Partial AB-hydrolase lipase domain-containing protein n=1 Tax=Steinernema hermaphroditum TaxID=289476 RepID=A0AA39I362_9BILA|nr:hypothetical protein QR680_012036 [Steinernema hermaphroditum]